MVKAFLSNSTRPVVLLRFYIRHQKTFYEDRLLDLSNPASSIAASARILCIIWPRLLCLCIDPHLDRRR